jgi:hypothetical protein
VIGEQAEQLARQTVLRARHHDVDAEIWAGSSTSSVSQRPYSRSRHISFVADFSKLLAGGFSLAAAVLAGLSTLLNPGQEAEAHKTASARYDGLADRTQLFAHSTCASDATDARLLRDFTNLLEEKERLAEKSPHVARMTRRLAEEHRDSRADRLA